MSPRVAQADPTQEFLMSCTYGVLAGTLVGAASLAFTEQPGDNLRNVARGASLGLYLGIFLGLYVVYVVPGQIERENQRMQEQLLPPDPGLPPEVSYNFQVYPLFSEGMKWDGMAAGITIDSF